MNQSNRCPRCEGVANHTITDIDGENYYQCQTGLTSFQEKEGEVVRVSRIVACDTFIHKGKVFSGTLAYVTGGKLKTLVVAGGKIK